MDLEPTADQKAVREAFGEFFADLCPISVVRAAEPLGHDADLWTRLCAIGAPGMSVDDKHGGGGASRLDLVLLLQEAGRVLAPAPLAEHAAAARLLAATGAGAPWFGDVVEGTLIAAFAPRPADPDGMLRLVPAGAVADVVVGLDGEDLVAVRSAPPMSGPANHACAPLADRSLRDGDRTVLASGAEALRLHTAARSDWQVLVAAALCGICERSLEIAVEYVMERQQFGRPVGAFQAVQQGLADLVPHIDGIRLLTARAAWTLDEGDPQRAEELASMAFLAASDVARTATYRAVHYHGGYGVTLEYDIQLFFRRARGWPLVAGDPDDEYQRLADNLFGPVVGPVGGGE